MWCGHIQGGMWGQGTYTEAGKPRVNDHLKNRERDGKILLRWMLWKQSVRMGGR